MTRADVEPARTERRYTESDLKPLLDTLTVWRDGDFRRRVPHAPPGILSEIRLLLNEVADRREHLANELARVRREVIKEGRFGERLTPGPGVGSWAESVESVNGLIDALVTPVTGAADVIDAVAKGDLSQRIDLDRAARGEVRRLGKAINVMVDQLALFTGEVTRVAREVGTEGKLGGRANLRGMSGSWRDLTEAVNTMSSRVSAQVRDIGEVTTAVANGDLSRKVTVDAVGEMFELKITVNTMVDQLSAFAEEVTRVAREVGTEGKLGGQAQVRGVSGVWKDLTDNVNFMANNLTSQVRQIAAVSTAVAQGNLTKKITVDAQGEILELKETLNTMVDQLSGFADEVTRVAREVGTEGRLGGRAEVKGVSGVWKDLTDNVNSMAKNLTYQVRNIAQVTTAVAGGDLTRKIDVDAQGEILELKSTMNTMVDQLSCFAAEVTRVAREVGTEGRLGGQAQVEACRGLEGPHRQRQLHGQQPDQPGPPDRRRLHRRRPGQPDQEDHRGRPGRDPGAQGHDEHDGRPALRRSPTRSPASAARWAPRASWAGRPGARRVGGLEGPHRQHQLDGDEPDLPGPQHRRGHHGGRRRRPDPQDRRRRPGRDARHEDHDQHDGRPALLVRLRGHPSRPRGGLRGPARRPGPGRGRRGLLEAPHRERQRAGRRT